MKKIDIKSLLPLCLPFVVSGVLLTVIQVPIGWSWLAWVAWVPFILVCSPRVSYRRLAVAAYVVSFCYWLGNLYWMCQVTWMGCVAFCLYTAGLWPILVFAVRFCRAKRLPLFIFIAIFVVGIERLQGFFLDGFYWRFLAHSQYANIRLIQISDIFGASGVSFLIAMVNGLIAELVIAFGRKKGFAISQLLKVALVCGALVGTLIYGQWRIEQTEGFVEDGPMVASLQSNVPQSVKESLQAEGEIFDGLMEKSKAAAGVGAALIVWPETMVQGMLNSVVWPFLPTAETSIGFDKALKEHSKDRAFVLVGAPGIEPELRDDGQYRWKKYNSAFLYKTDGTQAAEQYNKIHLVPFGEVVPFKRSAPWLHGLLMNFTPYDYDYTLDFGTEYTVFEMGGEEGYKFGVMICYEGTVPAIARNFSLDGNGGKGVDWLVNISNDGWFVKFENGNVLPSAELPQHTVICVFRAVENRVAVIRSVNTGISCLIDTVGRLKNGYLYGDLPIKVMERSGIAGWFADKMPIDARVTFFSRYGQWLDFWCAVVLVLFVVIAVVMGKVKNKR